MGGGIGMGNTCKPMAVPFKCMTKSTTNKKKRRYNRILRKQCWVLLSSINNECSECLWPSATDPEAQEELGWGGGQALY